MFRCNILLNPIYAHILYEISFGGFQVMSAVLLKFPVF